MGQSNPLAIAHLAGVKIRQWREARGLSAKAFGEQLDPARVVPEQTIYNWETQGKIARPHHQRLLADKGVCVADDWLATAPAEAA